MTVYVKYDHLEREPYSVTLDETPQYAVERFVGIDPALPGGGGLIEFRLFDDDGELYFSGELHDDPECENQMAALRWGEAYAGCTRIDVLRDGEWVGEVA